MIARRGFLAGILAAGSAPALCKAGFLMPVKALELPKFGLPLMGPWDEDASRHNMTVFRPSQEGFYELSMSGVGMPIGTVVTIQGGPMHIDGGRIKLQVGKSATFRNTKPGFVPV